MKAATSITPAPPSPSMSSSRKLGGSHSPSTSTSSSCASRRIGGAGTMASGSASFQENDGIRKSGMVMAHFHSTKSKKVYYGVLTERSFELHESQKAQMKKKSAKYIVDLAHIFNTSLQHSHKLKQCVSLMSPDETLLIKAVDGDRETIEWYERLMSVVIPARALHLGRPVFSNEYFECAWDVKVVGAPRLKKPVTNPDSFPNICLKLPGLAARPQRLCFYPHTIILCALGIEPATKNLPASGIPPFNCSDFIEFSRQFVANFGCQEKFFILRVGRASPTGQCEVWMKCESEEVANEIRTSLSDIIERESEKKKKGLTAALGTALTPTSPDQNQHQHQSLSPRSTSSQSGSAAEMNGVHPDGIAVPTSSTALSLSTIVERLEESIRPDDTHPPGAAATRRKHSSNMSQNEREKRSVLRNYKAKVDSLEEEQQRHQIYYEQQRKEEASKYLSSESSFGGRCRPPNNVEQAIAADIARSRRTAMRSNGGNLDGIFPFDGPAPTTKRSSMVTPSSTFVIEIAGHRESLISRSSSAAEEETEDSGGTLRMTSYEGHSRSNSSLNLPITPAFPIGSHLVQTQVECHQSPVASAAAENTPPSSVTNYLAIDHHQQQQPAAVEEIELSVMVPQPPPQPQPQQRVEEDEDSCCSSTAAAGAEGVSTTSSITSATTDESLSSSSAAAHQRKMLYRKNPQQQLAPVAAPEEVDTGEYMLMDKASCSSSISHLAVPTNYEGSSQQLNPEEVSYASDSGDSCYSSMNGQRTFSFSTDIPHHPIIPLPRQQQQHSSRAANAPHYQFLSAYLGLGAPLNQSSHSIKSGTTPAECLNTTISSDRSSNCCLESPSSVDRRHFGGGGGGGVYQQAPARLSNGFIHPATATAATTEDDPRRRTFSLGSSSWLPKPFRKLSSNAASKHHSHQSRTSMNSKSDGSGGCLTSRHPSNSSFTSATKTTSFIIADGSGSGRKGSQPAAQHQHHHTDLVELDFCNGTGTTSKSTSIESVQRSRTGSYEDAHSNSGSIKRQQPHLMGGGGGAAERALTLPSTNYSEDSYTEQAKLAGRAGSGSSGGGSVSTSGSRPRVPTGKSRKAHGHTDKAYALQEVRCFISPMDREKLNALLCKDSNSVSSQKTASDSIHFETIEEDLPLSSPRPPSSREPGEHIAVERIALEQPIA